MPNIKNTILSLGLLVVGVAIDAMTSDSRYIPLFDPPRLAIENTRSAFIPDYFLATGSKSLDRLEREIGMWELAGKFDQGKLADAFVAAGLPNPLRSEWQGIEIPLAVEGKLQAQAVDFSFYQPVTNWLYVGCSWMFMRVNTSQEFFLNCKTLKLLDGDAIELDESRRSMLDQLGLLRNHNAQLGFGDVDAYVWLGRVWDYELKFRRIDVGSRLGLLIPSGVKRQLDAPTSIPFGGNGHWGAYVEVDGIFELKEDFKVGFLTRVIKRFSRTSCQRMPVLVEPYIYGVAVGQVTVNPGPTFLFSPYVVLENLRKGFGVAVQYHLTNHWKDSWKDARTDRTVPVKLAPVEELSDWASDYFTLEAFYDFGKEKAQRSFDPILMFRWDVPAMFFMTKNIVKTNRVSISLECAF
jgi:hypothetical protein